MTTTTAGPTEQTFNAGDREIGSTFTISQCNFLPGASVAVTVNGNVLQNVIAGADGCIRETFEIKPTLVALGGLRSAVLHPLAATGLFAAGTKVQVAVNGQLLTIGPIGSTVNSVAKGTGFNNQPRTFNVNFRIVKKGTTDGNGNSLARTGATVVKWAPLGAALLAVGYLLLLVTRKRRETA